MYSNTLIRSVGKYIPKNKYTNDYFIKHFKEEGMECEGLLKAFKRDTRYFCSSEESSLSMGIEAAKSALKGMNLDSIDLVVFVSSTPEYTSPSNALIICSELELKNCQRSFDMNANCTGMLDAMYIVNNILKQDETINKALIIGSEIFSTVVNYHCTASYCLFADGACAMVLENVEEDIERGFIDYEFKNKPNYIDKIVYPSIGFSNVLMSKPKNREKRLRWDSFKLDFVVQDWVNMINNILNRNNIKEEDIVGWCMTQLFPRENLEVLRLLGYDSGKYSYIGDKYGYTGNSSPILALIEGNYLQEGNGYIIFNSIATGVHYATVLYKK